MYVCLWQTTLSIYTYRYLYLDIDTEGEQTSDSFRRGKATATNSFSQVHTVYVTQVTAAPSRTHTRAMGLEGSSPVRLHWRARQRDVDTGEGPRGYRRYPRKYRRYLRDGIHIHKCIDLDTNRGGAAPAQHAYIYI